MGDFKLTLEILGNVMKNNNLNYICGPQTFLFSKFGQRPLMYSTPDV